MVFKILKILSKSIFSATLAACTVVNAAENDRVVFDLDSGDISQIGALQVHQNGKLIVVSDTAYKKILCDYNLLPILELPKPTLQFINPQECFDGQFDMTKWQWVSQGEAFYMKTTPKSMKMAVTHSLMDCVGIAVTHPTQGVAFTHMDTKKWGGGLLERLLKKFPEEIRSECKVTLVSSLYSVLLSGVYRELIGFGYNKSNFYADIEPIFTDILGKYGAKDQRYISETLLDMPLSKIQGLKRKDIEPILIKKCSMPRALIVDLSCHNVYSFYQDRSDRSRDSIVIYNSKKIVEDAKKHKLENSNTSNKK